MKQKKRYISIKGYKGIRKDLITEKLIVRKTIKGKTHSATFDTIKEAVHWSNAFHPSLTFTKFNPNKSKLNRSPIKLNPLLCKNNGVETQYLFSDVWELYQNYHFVSLEKSSVEDRVIAAQKFYDGLMDFKMVEINSRLLDDYMREKVRIAKETNNPRRYNFNNDLKNLSALLNWYRNNYDADFRNPILPRHKVIGSIKKKSKQREKMTREEVILFLNSFDLQFWRDFAEFHFYATARVQEVGGLQKKNVNLKSRKVRIIDVAIWGNHKKFSYLKEIPKNGEERFVYINNRLKEILERRLAFGSDKPCKFFYELTGKRLDFVFHIDGEPLSYRQIQYQYNKALKKAGLDHKYSSTHFIRKSMANIVRRRMGLDAAQAVGGWKSREVVEDFYTDVPVDLNVEALKDVEIFMSDRENLEQNNRVLRIVGTD